MCSKPLLLVFGLSLSALAAGIAPAMAQSAGAGGTTACEPWVNYPADKHSNAPSPYLGCTQQENLENMVEDKNDLKQGKMLGPSDGKREADAVQRYEDGKVKQPQQSSSALSGILLQSGTMGGNGQ